jgi:D-sedoheptulose 7-phosphate isomerase
MIDLLQAADVKIASIIEKSIEVKAKVLQNKKIITTVREVAELCVEAFRNGNKVLFCGNGGSAADAQHLAAEFSGRFYKDRDPLPSEALHVNTSYMTAVANDYSYNQVYSRIVKGSGKAGDVLIGLSTSGNSENIIAAFQQARTMGITTVGLTGETGGKMKPHSDFLIAVPSTDTPRIQESHILLGHIICQLVEETLYN